jgi:hypothetical protein
MVVRRGITQVVPALGVLLAVLVAVIGAAPARAGAAPRLLDAPKHSGPTSAQIAGKGIADGKLVIQQAERPELFQMLMSEVSWLANATPQTTPPTAKKLGPRYTVTLYTKNTAQQTYDLYPLASGGPRAHRPAKQPSGKKVDGWFYGRLTMSETLRFSGVPLAAKPDVVNGGIGGGVADDVSTKIDPVEKVNTFLADLRRLFLLNGAVLVVILFGLGGISYLIRRRV